MPDPTAPVTAKLVRDRIPHIAEVGGQTLDIRTADVDELPGLLRAKLREEVDEYLDSGEVEELADVLEVLYALADRDELERLRVAKRAERGGFERRYVLAGSAPVTADDLRDRMRGREAACRAFAGQPPDEAGVYELPPDRDPWTALDDALNAMWAEVAPELGWLRAELARLRAGEADEPGERDAQPTAAQLLRRLNDANVDKRLRIIERMLDANDRASSCFVMDHEAAIEDQRRRADRAEEARDEQKKRADWLRGHAEWLSNDRDALNAAVERARGRLDALIADGFGATTDTLRELRVALATPDTDPKAGG